MNHFHRAFLPVAALVIFAGALSAADTLELKQRWIAGKKYYQTTETIQTNSVTIAGESREQSNSTTFEMSAAVRAQGDGQFVRAERGQLRRGEECQPAVRHRDK